MENNTVQNDWHNKDHGAFERELVAEHDAVARVEAGIRKNVDLMNEVEAFMAMRGLR